MQLRLQIIKKKKLPFNTLLIYLKQNNWVKRGSTAEHWLDCGGDTQVAYSWCGELPGVQVGDVLHDLLKALDIISLQS